MIRVGGRLVTQDSGDRALALLRPLTGGDPRAAVDVDQLVGAIAKALDDAEARGYAAGEAAGRHAGELEVDDR